MGLLDFGLAMIVSYMIFYTEEMAQNLMSKLKLILQPLSDKKNILLGRIYTAGVK